MASKRTRALNATPKTRAIVFERDSIDGYPNCIFCGATSMLTLAHYIAKSQGGLGIEENLAVACIDCHAQYDHGYSAERAEKEEQFREYLQCEYPQWDIEILRYQR